MTRRQLHIFRSIFVLYLVAVLWLCFGTFSHTPHVDRFYFGLPADKVAHFLLFLPFPVLAFLAFDKYTETFWSPVGYTALTFFCGCLLAAGTEVGQTLLTSTRTGDPADFRADLIGLATGSLLVFIFDLSKQRRHE